MSGGMSGDGFFDDFLSGINKVGETIGNIAPHIATGLDLYDKVKGRKGKGMSGGSSVGRPFSDVAKGMGYSGGVRRGAEMADIASPSGQFSVVAGRTKPNGSGMSGGKRPKLVKGSAEAKAYMASIRNKRGKGMSGGGAGVYGMPELLGRTTQALEGRGGTDGFPSGFKDNNPLAMSGGAVPLDAQLKGILNDRTLGSGMSGGDFWSDFADGFKQGFMGTLNVASKILPFVGLGEGPKGCGMSGGNVPSELALMSGSMPLAEAFLGGRRPQDVPHDEKVMLMKKALADYAMMKQLKKHFAAAQGRGKLTITHGAGMSGGDEGLANSSLDMPMGMGMSGGKRMKGGALSYEGNMAMADAMGDIFSGMGESGGASERAVGCGMSGGRSHRLLLKPQMQGTSMSGMGKEESESEDEEEKEKKGGRRPARLVKGSAEAKAYMARIRNKKGRGLSGGGIMEPAVSAEVGQPRYSYGQMADTAGKSNVGSGGGRKRKGKGMSGGDFWSDLGNVASAAAPFLALL